MNIITEYPLWWTVFCLLAGILLAFILYYKERKIEGLKNWLKILLATFRAAAIALLSFFLLGPLLKSIDSKVEQPIIIFAQDNSQSIIANADSSFYKSEYLASIDEFKTSLDEKFDLEMFQFDDVVSDKFAPDYNGIRTNVSNVLDEVYNRFSNRNIGAVVIASDGIYNEGANPVYAANKLNVPIYTIAAGDTTINKDLVLENVAHNRLTYLGNDFPIEVLVKASKLSGKKSNLSIRHKGNVVFNQTVDITDQNFISTFQVTLPANTAGIQKYQVSLSPIDNEQSTTNNYKSIYIEVMDNKQNVLILAEQIHPDIAAIRYTLENNSNYEVKVLESKDFNGELNDYSLIILHQIPGVKRTMGDLIKKAKELKKQLLYIIGSQTNLKNLNLLDAGLTVTTKQKSLNNVGAKVNSDFSLFKLDPELIELVPKFPPLQSPFAEYTSSNSSELLLKQKIGQVDTEFPLLLFNEINGNKNAVLVGEGIWRWRLFDYLENDSHDMFDGFILKTVQYLATREDKSFFRVYNETKFDQGDHIYIEAELYNRSYELVNEPEVKFVLSNEDGTEFPYNYSRKGDRYFLDLSGLEAGEYSFVSSTSYSGDVFRKTGSFSITKVVLEQLRTTADHNMLYNLSEKTGGKMFYPNQLSEVADAVIAKKGIAPVLYTTKKLSDWINLKWIFFLVLGLLSIEWFIRKYKGAY